MNKNDLMYSNDKISQELLDTLHENEQLYKNIYDFLVEFGNFDKNICFQIYEISNNKNKNFSKLWCEDNDSNIFIICTTSSNKNDTKIIEKINNSGHYKYNLSLIKKEKPTIELEKLLLFDSLYNFKLGRLVTNGKDFFTILLGNNISYCINISDLNGYISINELLSKLNNIEKKLTLIDFSNIVNQLIMDSKYNYLELEISAYRDFKLECIYSYKNDDISRKRS